MLLKKPNFKKLSKNKENSKAVNRKMNMQKVVYLKKKKLYIIHFR